MEQPPFRGGSTVPRAGPVARHGVAFGGARVVRRLAASVNGGRTLEEARLVGPDLGRYAWRRFAPAMTLPAGRIEHRMGSADTSWRDHAVPVTAS